MISCLILAPPSFFVPFQFLHTGLQHDPQGVNCTSVSQSV